MTIFQGRSRSEPPLVAHCRAGSGTASSAQTPNPLGISAIEWSCAPISGIARIYRSARDASVGDHLTIMLLFSAIRQRPEPVLALNQNRELSTRADDGKDRTT
jgi:hypothetical protein